MKRASFFLMNSRIFRPYRLLWLGLCLIALVCLPALADEKPGMPDLCQDEQTCLPTSTANLIVWFGLHGYPKLIVSGDSKDDGYIHTVHSIMAATDARFDWGTREDMVTIGIKKYIQQAGYDCDVEYRGLGKAAFTQDWLKENDNPNKGFILLLNYCHYNEGNNTFTDAINAGHAITLVNAESDMILVHDPAHPEDETGRKILTPQVLTSGKYESGRDSAPVAGLMLLSGTLLGAPPDAGVMLTGAVCITMHPAQDPIGSSSSGQPSGTNSIGSNAVAPPSTPSTPAAPASTSTSWVLWLFNLFFKK